MAPIETTRAQRRAPLKRDAARRLRAEASDAERKLWFLLRSLKSLGLHFRRQAPIGIFCRAASSAALRASPSLKAPSATNRRAMPVRPASGAGFIWIAIGIGCNPLKSRM